MSPRRAPGAQSAEARTGPQAIVLPFVWPALRAHELLSRTSNASAQGRDAKNIIRLLPNDQHLAQHEHSHGVGAAVVRGRLDELRVVAREGARAE